MELMIRTVKMYRGSLTDINGQVEESYFTSEP